MIVPPLNEQHEQPCPRNTPPQFHISSLDRGRRHFCIFAELQFITRFDVALRDIQKICAEQGVVCAEVNVVDALFEGLAINKFVGIRVELNVLDRTAGDRERDGS